MDQRTAKVAYWTEAHLRARRNTVDRRVRSTEWELEIRLKSTSRSKSKSKSFISFKDTNKRSRLASNKALKKDFKFNIKLGCGLRTNHELHRARTTKVADSA